MRTYLSRNLLTLLIALIGLLSAPASTQASATQWENVKNGFIRDLDKQLDGSAQRRELFPKISLHASVKTRLMITVSAVTWQDTFEQREYMLKALRGLWVQHCGKHSPDRKRCTIQVHDPRGRFVGGSDDTGRLSVR